MLTLHEMPPAVRQAVLGEMSRVLRTDGRLLIIDFHPGAIQFPKGWLFKAVVYFFEIMAGYEHFKNFRHFMSLDGICGLISPHQLQIETTKIVGGGNVGIYVLSLPSSAVI
jgi:ubiquinone/menaquinone biosynthesis C-methylase UbiE